MGVARSITSVRGLMIGLGSAFGAFKLTDSFIDANSQLETMKIRLEGMLGSAEKGEQAFEWIKQFQLDNPIADLQTMTKQFVGLVSAGIDPTTGAMKGLIGAMAKYSLTADDLNGVTRALRQMTALTNAQKQELNQLVERIPQLTKIVAKEMEMTQEELLKNIHGMTVNSMDLARATLRALEKDGADMIKKMEGTWQAYINRLKTAWFELMIEIGDAGYFDSAKQFIKTVTDGIKNAKREVVIILDALKDTVKTLFGGMLDQMKNLNFKEIAQTAIVAMMRIAQGFKLFTVYTANLVDLISELFKGIVKLGEYLKEWFDKIGSFFSIAGSTADGFFSGLTGRWGTFKGELKEVNKEFNILVENFKKRMNAKELKISPNVFTGDDTGDLADIKKAPEMIIGNDFVRGMSKTMDVISKKWEETYGNMEKMGMKFAETTARAMGDSFDKFFFDVLEGNLKQAKDYFNDFFKSIARAIAQVANQRIAMGIINGIVGSIGGLSATPSNAGSNLGAGTYQTSQPTTMMSTGGSVLAKAGAESMSAPISVNIVNESGQPVRAKSAQASQSTSGMLLSVVLEGLSRNEGGSRDALRGMMMT